MQQLIKLKELCSEPKRLEEEYHKWVRGESWLRTGDKTAELAVSNAAEKWWEGKFNIEQVRYRESIKLSQNYMHVDSCTIFVLLVISFFSHSLTLFLSLSLLLSD